MNTHLKPIILTEGKYTSKEIEKLKIQYKVIVTKDLFLSQLKEVFEINNPDLSKDERYEGKLKEFVEEKLKVKSPGNWICFPWNNELVHTVSEKEYFALRTNRNKLLITEKEQNILYGSCIAVVGLSVGGAIASALPYQSIGKYLKLAEFDTLDTTNLNRVRATISDIGTEKINVVSEQIYSINPYSEIYYFDKGLNDSNLGEFIYGNPKPSIIFEVIDDFEMKIKLRIEARKARIPVVMFSNLGDSVLVDIERFDFNSKLPLFNGVLGELPEEILNNPNEDKNKYAVAMVGMENVPPRAMETVKQIGKTLVGRPQLSSTVALSGTLACYLSRKLLTTGDISSGRFKVDLDKLFHLQ